MATNVDTAVSVAARKGTIFTMSDGNLVAVYYNGTAWGYRIKASGTWGARTALTSSPAQTGAVWAQDGNNLFGAVSGPSFFYIYKLAYASGAITQTNTLTGDNGVVVAGYVDTTNARFNVPVMLSNAGIYLYSFATSNLAVGINASQITAGSPPTTLQTDVTWAAAGAGAGTWQLAWFATAGATAFNVVTMVTTTTAITSQTAETSVPALAANCTGLDAIYDGTDIVFVANQNNAALRWSRRTAANTYAAWTTLVTETIAGRPALARKGTGASSDVAALYRSNASQANGEIRAFKRISGTWDTSSTTVAGGASTGWLEPVARSDINQATSGVVPVAYLTGTANPWTLVEDSFAIGSGGTALTKSLSDTATITDNTVTSGTNSYSQTIPDTASIADAVGNALSRTIADSVAATDTGATVDTAYTLADTASLTDSANTGGSTSRTQNVDDTATVADSLANAIATALTDSASIADQTVSAATFARILADTATITDQPTTVSTWARVLADTAAVADSVSNGSSTAHTRAVDDLITGADTTSTSAGVARIFNEAAVISDLPSRTLASALSFSDGVSVADQIGGVTPIIVVLAEVKAGRANGPRVGAATRPRAGNARRTGVRV